MSTERATPMVTRGADPRDKEKAGKEARSGPTTEPQPRHRATSERFGRRSALAPAVALMPSWAENVAAGRLLLHALFGHGRCLAVLLVCRRRCHPLPRERSRQRPKLKRTLRSGTPQPRGKPGSAMTDLVVVTRWRNPKQDQVHGASAGSVATKLLSRVPCQIVSLRLVTPFSVIPPTRVRKLGAQSPTARRRKFHLQVCRLICLLGTRTRSHRQRANTKSPSSSGRGRSPASM